MDDKLVVADSNTTAVEVVNELEKHFELKDLGEPQWLLGMRIERDRTAGLFHLSQEAMIRKMLHQYGLLKASMVPTPKALGMKLSNR